MLSHLTTEIYMQDNQTLQEHGFGENRMTSAHADKNWALNYENLQINCKSTTKLLLKILRIAKVTRYYFFDHIMYVCVYTRTHIHS